MLSSGTNKRNMDAETVGTSVSFPVALRAFLFVGLFFDALYWVVALWDRYRLHWGYPYDYPGIPFNNWRDLTCFFPRFHYLHRPEFFSNAVNLFPRFMYPAPIVLLYKAFYLAGSHTVVTFFTVTLGLLLALLMIQYRAMVKRGIERRHAALFLVLTLIGSYPLWFEYSLCNMEICIFLLVTFGMIAFLRERYYLCAFLIAIAASMKLFPFIYLALFISRRKYRQIAFGFGTIAVLNVVSLWYLGPTILSAYRGIEDGLQAFRRMYMLQYRPLENGFDHSLFAFCKNLLHNHYAQFLPSSILNGYLLVAAVAGLALYFFRIKHLPTLNQILCLCIIFVLLPPTSHDYTLLHLYFPWATLTIYAIESARLKYPVRGLRSAFVCFAILFSCQSEFILHHAGRSAQIKTVALIYLLILALRHPFPSAHLWREGFQDNTATPPMSRHEAIPNPAQGTQ